MITVDPVIEVEASPAKVSLGASSTLYCHVIRANPEIHKYIWKNEDTNTLLNGSNSTLMVMFSNPQNFGTISCEAVNIAGRGKANVTVERGCKSCIQWQYCLICRYKCNFNYIFVLQIPQRLKSLNQMIPNFMLALKLN